jgi:hypothetical protein
MKTPPLRLVYQRAGIYDPTPGGTSLSGFGLGSDGTGHEMPRVHFYQLDALEDGPQLDNLTAFLLCFDTGTAPAVGRSVTVDRLSRNSALALAEITLLEGQVAANHCDLVVRGRVGGFGRRFRYVAPDYQSDRGSEPALSRTTLLDLLAPGDSLTFLGVPPGSGPRLGGDRDGDGIRDHDEASPWTLMHPSPGQISFQWPAGMDDWFPQTTSSPADGWAPWTTPARRDGGSLRLDWPTATGGHRFFRLHRTW